MEEKLRERLQKFMADKGLSVNALAKEINMQTRTLNNQIKTETAISALTLLEILFQYPELSAEWLMREKGAMYDEKSVNIAENTSSVETFVKRIADLEGVVEAQKKAIAALEKVVAAQDREIESLNMELRRAGTKTLEKMKSVSSL